MNKKHLIILTCAFNPAKNHLTHFGQQRIAQYVKGLRQIAQLCQQHPEFEVCIVDNTFSQDWEMPAELKEAIEALPLKGTFLFYDNELPKLNKGCGNVIAWRKAAEKINFKDYATVIHYEPRCELENFWFFEDVLKQPKGHALMLKYRVTALTYPWPVRMALKLVPLYRGQIWTVLFALIPEDFLDLLAKLDIEKMAKEKISLEDYIYNIIKDKDITPVVRLGVIWHAQEGDVRV